ncbi:MAG: YaiI/YqxD family protein [Desulfuromonas sp.]|nr:MAG: YaiI/YqxD family protein [Desulfuromonas sp.]
MLTIYVDADACPVKQEVVKVAKRYSLPVIFVANSRMRLPEYAQGRLEVVADHLDAADDWIVEQAGKDDIVITSDIPLASRSVDVQARVIDPSGRIYNEDNVGHALATRNLMADLREGGTELGGPAPFQAKDRSRFLQSLDQVVQQVRRDN